MRSTFDMTNLPKARRVVGIEPRTNQAGQLIGEFIEWFRKVSLATDQRANNGIYFVSIVA